MALINSLSRLHHTVFAALARQADSWLLGLLARLAFAAVLFLYFWNSAMTKIGEGLFGIFSIQDSAYYQILGEAGMTAYEFDTANIPWFVDLIVMTGTWAEIVLPPMIILGLFTRIAAIGMSVFVLVQSWVDINIHKVDAGTIGALFDRDSASVIMDQRALWLFVFVALILKGAGSISLDKLLANRNQA